MEFSWDDEKNAINQEKHGVSFEEAQSIFWDDFALLIHDPDHSVDEERFVMMGTSSVLRVLVVCHCYRNSDDEVRIISARKAQKKEREFYEKSTRRF